MNEIASHRPRASEKMWLEAALDLLLESGVDSVKIMPLAKRLGLTRTGFYHHFKDRDALLEALVLRWEAKNTGNLVAQCETFAETVSEAVLNLQDCWLDKQLFDARLDLAIRNWSRWEPSLKQRVANADARRKTAVKGIFERFGYAEQEAEVRTMAILYTQVGYISMEIQENPKERLNNIPAYVELFTGVKPSAGEIRRFNARHES